MRLSNYALKVHHKGATDIDTSTLASKTDLTSLKTKVNNLNVDKLKTASADLSKLSNVVENDVVKKTVYNKVVTTVKAADTKIRSTCGLVTKTQYDSDKQGLENNGTMIRASVSVENQ